MMRPYISFSLSHNSFLGASNRQRDHLFVSLSGRQRHDLVAALEHQRSRSPLVSAARLHGVHRDPGCAGSGRTGPRLGR
jgi:hypothetical protein